jgi:hypothetical protein
MGQRWRPQIVCDATDGVISLLTALGLHSTREFCASINVVFNEPEHRSARAVEHGSMLFVHRIVDSVRWSPDGDAMREAASIVHAFVWRRTRDHHRGVPNARPCRGCTAANLSAMFGGRLRIEQHNIDAALDDELTAVAAAVSTTWGRVADTAYAPNYALPRPRLRAFGIQNDPASPVNLALFAHLDKVRIEDNATIVDVSPLAQVPRISLVRCANVVDVSPLANARYLDLTQCVRVVNVSALGRVATLVLAGCHEIADVSALGGVRHLNLSGCRRVRDVSALERVYTLILRGCVEVTDVSMLGGVRHLDLTRYPRLSRALESMPNAYETPPWTRPRMHHPWV